MYFASAKDRNDFLQVFNPDPDWLFDALRARVDDDMLQEIAEADYGFDSDKHLAALRRQCDHRESSRPFQWEPKEVLELIRWSEPEDPSWKPGSVGRRGHLMRAFACASLLRNAIGNSDFYEGENQTLVQLLDSLVRVAPEMLADFRSLTAYRLQEDELYDDEPLFIYALLLGVLLDPSTTHLDDTCDTLINWLQHETDAAISEVSKTQPWLRERWLFATAHFDLRHSRWKQLTQRVLDESDRWKPERYAKWSVRWRSG